MEHLQVWFDTSPQGVAFVKPVRDNRGVITTFYYQLVNKAFAHLFGLLKEDLNGKPVCTFFPFIPAHEFVQQLMTVSETGTPQQFQQHELREGADIWHQLALTRLDDQVLITIQDISEQKKSELEFQRRLTLESIISRISSRLITLNGNELDTYIVEALQEVSQYIGADRASVFLYSDDGQRGSCAYEWCNMGIQPHKAAIQNVSLSQFAWTHQEMENGRLIRLDINALPSDAIQEKAILTTARIQSMTLVPMRHQGKTKGFIGLYAIQQSYTWDENDISFLETLATLILGVLQRQQQEATIRRANQRLESLNTIDKALFSYRLADQHPLSIGLQYIQLMVPCDLITVFQFNKTTGLAVAKCQIVRGEVDPNPDITLLISSFEEKFQSSDQLYYCPELPADSAAVADQPGIFPQGFRSFLIVPLYSQNSCVGAFTLAATLPYFFTDEHQHFAHELAGSLATVLCQHQLDEQLMQHTDQLAKQVHDRTKEVQQLSNLHQAILKHAGQAIISTNLEGVIQTANQATEQLLGFRVDELIGRITRLSQDSPEGPIEFHTYASRESAGAHSNLFHDVLTTRGYVDCECIIRAKNGEQKQILLTTSVLQDEQGNLIGFVGIATDISALKTAKARLRSLNVRLELATQAANQGIWENDFETDSLSWDDRLWSLHGLAPQQADWTFQKFVDLIHPDDLPDFLECFNLGKISGQISTVTRIILPDGSIRYTETNGIVIRNELNEPVRAIGVMWDITERKLAEQALQDSEQRFREIAENVDEVFWIHSAQPFHLLYINPAFERIWNTNLEQVRNNPFMLLDSIVQEDQFAVLALINQYKAGQEGELYCRIKGVDDSLRWLFVRTFMIRDSSGQLIRHIGIISDVTSQKEKEQVLQNALLREQELNKLKSQFVATASHEFRTPLATIQTSVDLIKLYQDLPADSVRESIQKHLAVIENEVDLFSTLLTDILTIGKIESGKITFTPRCVDFVSICEAIIMTHFGRREDQRRVRLLIEGTSCPVVMDEKLISHVLINLLSNAFKFSSCDPILRIRFTLTSLVVEIEDKGIGIPAQDIPTLFQAFFRASNTNAIQGTGLGLVIARQFVELHGGHINIESEENEGTICTINLPIGDTDDLLAPLEIGTMALKQ